MKAPVVVEHTRSAMVTPAIPVEEGQTVRIRGFVRIPQAIKGSVDGAMIWDSLGGETLSLRYVKACDWTEFTLLRPVRKTGPMRLHLVMTGMGVAQFDDIKIEIAGDSPAPLAGRPPEETRR